jgi:hypothetical protein
LRAAAAGLGAAAAAARADTVDTGETKGAARSLDGHPSKGFASGLALLGDKARVPVGNGATVPWWWPVAMNSETSRQLPLLERVNLPLRRDVLHLCAAGSQCRWRTPVHTSHADLPRADAGAGRCLRCWTGVRDARTCALKKESSLPLASDWEGTPAAGSVKAGVGGGVGSRVARAVGAAVGGLGAGVGATEFSLARKDSCADCTARLAAESGVRAGGWVATATQSREPDHVRENLPRGQCKHDHWYCAGWNFPFGHFMQTVIDIDALGLESGDMPWGGRRSVGLEP